MELFAEKVEKELQDEIKALSAASNLPPRSSRSAIISPSTPSKAIGMGGGGGDMVGMGGMM